MSPTARSTTLLAGRTAVVTGAARGIGFAIARMLATHGASVALLDLDKDATTDAAQTVAKETGAQTLGLACDVADPAAVSQAADQIAGTLGSADVVVPNAGILVLKSSLDLSPDELTRVLNVNVLGSFVTATEFSRRLIAAGRPGSIIFTSSLFGTRGGAGNAAYSASKFAIIGLAQSMAADLATNGIRVNCVCPGQIDSVMLDQLFNDRAAASKTSPEHERQRFVQDIPLGRLGLPEDVADTYVYLASALSAYVTGQHIIVDGGWSVG